MDKQLTREEQYQANIAAFEASRIGEDKRAIVALLPEMTLEDLLSVRDALNSEISLRAIQGEADASHSRSTNQ